MNVKCTLNSVVVYIVEMTDISGRKTEIIYVKDSDKKMYLGIMSWNSADEMSFTEVREIATAVTAIDGIVL